MTTKLQRIRFALMEECETCGAWGICGYDGWGTPEGPHDGTGQGRCGCLPEHVELCSNCRRSLAWAVAIVVGVRVLALVAVALLLFWLTACGTSEDSYDACRAELARGYAAGEAYHGQPPECVGLQDSDVTMIWSEVLRNVTPSSTLD